MASAAVEQTNKFSLICEKCGHTLPETADQAMQLVGLFKPSLVAIVARTHAGEIRRRCRHCGFVNVFHPVLTESWRHNIVLK